MCVKGLKGLPEDIWFYLAMAFGLVAIALLVLFLMELERRKKLPQESKENLKRASLAEIGKALPLTISLARSVPEETVKETRDKLRILELEREILSYAIRRLYEAQAEGKITVEERDTLASKYKEDLERIKQEIARGESIIALSELERMQEEFIKMFSERIDILNRRIEELRAIAGLAPLKPITKPREASKEAEKSEEHTLSERLAQPSAPSTPMPRKRRETPKPTAPAGEEEKATKAEHAEKSEAEKKVEQIMAEVEKVLNRLSQMEVEG